MTAACSTRLFDFDGDAAGSGRCDATKLQMRMISSATTGTSINRRIEENEERRGTMRLGTRKFTLTSRRRLAIVRPHHTQSRPAPLVVSPHKSAPRKKIMKRFFAYALVVFSIS